ncbi:hypothetical protein CERSUDRAFT_93826 [Gelatoporia subvermispora B]|uniref:RRN6 K-rich C-terminal domain-containing protein n=1 Tax=Ceriporiopsis subvermispora (strain B) TaxID=914234 RepID=M2RHK6_CERS8|nr:hypothetical protein CERSUDRAFT_93826 [Gelatoporia subvermispora B]
MLLPPSGEQTAIIVNDIGSVYASNIFQGSKLPQLVFSRTSIHDDGPDRTWRLSEGAGTGSCLLLHSDFTHLLDFRSQNSALDIFQVSRPGESLTSVKSLPDKHLLCLSTTRELLWLDVRQPGRPLLGVCHNRGFDRSLTLETRQVAGVSLTFLASHRNSLVTVYDVSPLSGHALGVNTMPYALPPAQIPDGHNLGRTFVQDPPFASSKDISLFQLSESSGLHVLNMRLVEDEPSSLVGGDAADIQQTSEACVSEEQTKCSPMDFGPLDMRDNAEVDLRSAYDVIFISEPKTETGDSTYDALDKMPYFWQEVDAPVEHMLTTYDIAFRSGPEPTGPNRSDLLTQSVLNSVRGHRAMVGGRIPLPQVIRGAPWHLDITPSLHRFDEDIHKEPADIEDALRRYDLSSDTDRSSQSRQMESAAREQLALDLFLSKDVFSSHQLLKPTDPDLDNEFETMSRAAQAMSLDESEPPPVRFGFLRPINRTSSNNYSNTETENDLQATRGDKLGTPLGVRLLLNEWEVGADSREYTYIDPYGSTSTPSQILRRNVKARQQTYGPEAKASAIDSNQPPRIKPSIGVAPPVIAATQPSVLERPSPPRPLRTSGPNGSPRPRMEIGSQRPRESGFAAVSQEFMASTQVLPGPHGGRPSMMKKKPARKRVGGF